jgi:small conductance mechanosensitive channel
MVHIMALTWPGWAKLAQYEGIYSALELRRWLNIVLILLLAAFLLRILRLAVRKMKNLAKTRTPGDRQAEQRTETLAQILHGIGRVIILVLAGIQVLAEIGVNITPIIASAGIVGVAVGFGAQNLVRNIIAGFFILLDNQYRIGDVVTLESRTGTVERMTLRVTTLRDMEGAVHFIPHGEIKTITVHSRDWAQAVVDIELATEQDVNRAIALMAEACESLARDWSDAVTDRPSVLGVQRLDPGSFTLRATMKTAPLRNWEVGRELRRRLLVEFSKEGIQLALPRLAIDRPRLA